MRVEGLDKEVNAALAFFLELSLLCFVERLGFYELNPLKLTFCKLI
jgi:hypothetical protein